jgi:hypothetical protein
MGRLSGHKGADTLLSKRTSRTAMKGKTRNTWLDGFVRWFFNASPVWVDEHDDARPAIDTSTPRERRVQGDRRRHADPRGSLETADRRRSPT